MSTTYETIIGLEIHLQLKTRSKMFCSCVNVLGDAEPNTAVCPTCMGHPGTLPVPNGAAIKEGIKLALALQGEIAITTRFDRKNYFYPDLPKGYQISQYATPLAKGGYLDLLQPDGSAHRIHLERIHMEEDAGKNIHAKERTLVDFNRAGVPLVEIVTRPDLRSPREAREFLQELRLVARTVGVSDADMEKGQLRCDANVSLRPAGDERFYPKIEVKNMNSFKAVERALSFEVSRQRALWDAGTQPLAGETRGWVEGKGETVSQRTKEESDDYRYFPEPDIPPIAISRAHIEEIARELPEMPISRRQRFMREYGLTFSEADVLVLRPGAAEYFEELISELRAALADSRVGEAEHETRWSTEGARLTKYAHSWLTTELYKHLNADGKDVAGIKISGEDMAEFVMLVAEGKLSSSAAQTVFEVMYREGRDPHEIAEEKDLFQTSDASELAPFIEQVIKEHPTQVAQYKKGKTNVIQFLVGKVMKVSGGRAHPGEVKNELEKRLKSL